MNLRDSLACEQALGLGVGGERKEFFAPPPLPLGVCSQMSHFASIFRNALDLFPLSLPFARFFCMAFSHAKPPRNIHAAREVALSRF